MRDREHKLQVTFIIPDTGMQKHYPGWDEGHLTKEFLANVVYDLIEYYRQEYFSGNLNHPNVAMRFNHNDIPEPTVFRQHRPEYLNELSIIDRETILSEMPQWKREMIETKLAQYRAEKLED